MIHSKIGAALTGLAAAAAIGLLAAPTAHAEPAGAGSSADAAASAPLTPAAAAEVAAPQRSVPSARPKCTAHLGNTQGWTDCTGGNVPYWVRLKYVCEVTGFYDQTYTGKWKLVQPGEKKIIKEDCNRKMVKVKTQYRRF